MNNSNYIATELKEISPLLAAMEKVNVYAAPAAYFNNLSNNMLTIINAEESNYLSSLKKQPAMSVPAGYFDSLAETVLSKIKMQEPAGEGQYPVLDTISRHNVYTVPNGYFENIGNQLLNKLNAPQAKVVGMGKRMGWFKYAAAAVFTGAVIFGAFKFTGNQAAETLPGYVAAGQQIKNVDAELQKLADVDIIKYLQAEGTEVEAALVATTIDEKELPAQEDYFTDEKTLDKFLENIDVKDLEN